MGNRRRTPARPHKGKLEKQTSIRSFLDRKTRTAEHIDKTFPNRKADLLYAPENLSILSLG
jgi:hypothetical protein